MTQHTYAYIHLYICTYTHRYTHTYIRIHTHIHTYVHTHTYTQTYTHHTVKQKRNTDGTLWTYLMKMMYSDLETINQT